MNESGQSRFNQARIEWAIRLLYSPMPRLDMEWLVSQLNAFRIGDMRVIGKTWEVMMERDGELAVNADKRCADLAGLEYNIASDGSSDGDRHAEALTYFYKHLRATHALQQDTIGGVSQLLYQLGSAHSYFYSAHEILLRVDNAAAKEVTAEFRHTPLWFFEARRGYLGYLQHIFDVYGQPCIEGEWLTAVGSGWMRPLSVVYVFKQFAMRDWAVFSARYGSGFLDGVTDATKGDPAWDEAKAGLEDLMTNGVWLHNRGVEAKFLDSPAKANLPQPGLVELANGLYAKCYRGVELATGSRSGGSSGMQNSRSGQNPVGASVMAEESGIFLERDAKWATAVLNERVDRSVIRYLFNQEPRAAISILPPQDDNTAEQLSVVTALVPLGLPIGLKDVYKIFGLSAPAAGDAILTAPAAAVPGNTEDPNTPASTSAPGQPVPVAKPPPGGSPESADESAAGTQPAQPVKPIGAGANPASMAQTASRGMPDPQADSAGFWSNAARNFVSAGAAIRRAITGPSSNGQALPAMASAIPNEGGQAGAATLTPQFEQASRDRLAAAVREDLSHMADQVKALLAIDDPEHFRAKAAQLQGKMAQITANTLLAPASADALQAVAGTAYLQGSLDRSKPAEDRRSPAPPQKEEGKA